MAHFAIDNDFLNQIELLGIILKNNVAGRFGGTHESKRFGSSCDFSDSREYVAGDNIARIDWNAYARFEKLFVKLYLDERQCHTRIYIDASKSMDYSQTNKANQALKMACALAYLSINQMDKVTIYAINNGQVIPIIENMYGKENFYEQINKLNDINFDGECSISEAILPSTVGYGDGMSIIISDFLTDLDYDRAIDYLCDKKRDILCVQIMSKDDLHPQIRGKVHFFDSENISKDYKKNIARDVMDAYYEALNYTMDRIKNLCLSRGANYLMFEDNEPFIERLIEMEVIE